MIRLPDLLRAGLSLTGLVFLALTLWQGGASLPGGEGQERLQLVSAALVLALILPATSRAAPGALRGLSLGLLAIALWGLLQLLPLPPELWTGLGNRQALAEGFGLLEYSRLPELAISLSPAHTAGALAALFPPLAALMLLSLKSVRAAGAAGIAAVVVAAALASALLGITQAVAAPSLLRGWPGAEGARLPSGFFANQNHQATFLLMALPLLAALMARPAAGGPARDRVIAGRIAGMSVLLILLTGIFAAGSLAGYLLLAPVGGLSLMILASRQGAGSRGLRRLTGLAPALFCLGLAALLVFSSPVLSGLGITSLEEGDLSRRGIWAVSLAMLEDHWLTGTGLGTYALVYPMYEDPARVTGVWINHAHNDYLQLAIELGLPGILLMLAAVCAWLILFIRAWKGGPGAAGQVMPRAASACLMVAGLHSLVDYPARSPAILVTVAICAVLLVWQAREDRASQSPSSKGGREKLRGLDLGPLPAPP